MVEVKLHEGLSLPEIISDEGLVLRLGFLFDTATIRLVAVQNICQVEHSQNWMASTLFDMRRVLALHSFILLVMASLCEKHVVVPQ